ncbi:DUF2110 family protein [Halorussus gelatinilyticus]|uniref:DUF2110 family protein n=1 Tax=Halorussus gelatinilyticus TaxID=2937524 RepID=A0A8U0IJG1_9EURY|nr:DUF2110 family protein [Halorussus gelatinilyticus]UPW00209.1 DUF2110 family protein [Halorussus gelatinilyticus]
MVVLATKVYVEGDARERSLDALRSLVANEIEDLDVEYTVGVRHDDFAVVTIEGDDEVVARNLLREAYGEVTPDFEPGETYVGTLEGWDDEGFVLDAGEEVRVPADELGLGQGSPVQIVERFGLVQHTPMKFVYGGDAGGDGDDSESDTDGETNAHRLADEERDRLYDWTRGAGRVNVNSATRGEVRATVNRAGHARDIVTVERLGLLEQSIVCKDETDPPGLLAAIGSYLPAEIRCVIP